MPEPRDADHDGRVGDGSPGEHPALRDFSDPGATRRAIFSRTLAAAKALPPVATKHHELSLTDVAFDGPETFSKERQKRAVLEGGTLERRLRGTFTLKDLATGQVMARKTTTLAHVPYLDDDGTFIHKGSAYSLASQLRLRAGIYSRRKSNGELESHVNTLPGGGRSHRIGLDPATGKFHIEVGQAKVPLTPALHALGVTPAELSEAWGPEVAQANRRDDHAATLRRLHSKLAHPSATPPEGDVADAVRAEFGRMKLDPEVTARTLGHPHESATRDALLATTKKLLAINRGEAEPDDRDHLAFMTAHGPEDLLAEKIARVKGPLHQALWRAGRTGNLDGLAPGILSPAVRGAILDSGLGNPGESINPAMIMDQIGRASRLGEGGISSTDAIPEESRNVHPSQLGFIDSIWTPESVKAGVDTRAASGVKKGGDGKIYAPFRDVRTGATAYQNPSDLAGKTVAFPNEMASGKPTVAAIRGGKLQSVRRDEVDFELPHFEHGFSPVMNMVPMKSAIKPQRASMGGRFLTQALPLLDPEAPMVRSGMPDRPGRSFEEEHGKAMGAVRAEKPGVVERVEPGRIVVRHDDGTTAEHELHVHAPMNRKTGRHQTPTVRQGQRVGPDDLLARSNFTDAKGVTALGKNARVAYMSHGGFNFEDAVVTSESMAKRLSSDHYYQHELEHGDGVVTGRDPHTALFPGVHDRPTLAKFDDDGVIRPGTEVGTGHPLILAAKQRDRTYGAIHPGRKASFSDATVTWDHHNPGVVTDVARTKKGTLVVVRSHAAAEVGDKLAGRYGDKGIISRIVPDDQMPRGEDGRPFEVLLNPLGIISRCYDVQTEFLTERGWKRGAEVHPHDKLLCFDPVTWGRHASPWRSGRYPGVEPAFGLCWLDQAAEMYVADYEGDLHCHASALVDIAVTPGHTMWAAEVAGSEMTWQKDPGTAWGSTTVDAVAAGVFVLLAGRRRGRSHLQKKVPDTLVPVRTAPDLWSRRQYRGKVYCPTVPTGFVVTRRRGKVVVAGNTNPAQMAEAALGKVAEKTGQPYAVRDFAGGDHVAYARAELARHGLTDTETVHDPEHNRQVPGIFTGNRFFMKLHHTAESKAQGRSTGGYSADGSPSKGGEAGSKRLSLMDSNALLSHGATSFLRDVAIRGQSSPRYWQQVMSGHTPPEPEAPAVYHKFFDQLRAAGLNPRCQGTRTHLLAMTDRDVDELAGGREVRNAETVDWKAGMKPVSGGLFDEALTGGSEGSRWAALKLHEPMPNPAFEEPARRMLGLTRAKFREVLAGRQELPSGGSGPHAIADALKAIDVDRALDHARREVESGRGGARDEAIRKLGYLKAAKEHGLTPGDWMLNRVPVLPPRFRPVSVMQGGLPMISDPNLLYKELHDANENLKAMSGRVEDLGDERLAVYDAFRGVTGLGDPLHPKNRERQVTGVLRKIFGEGGPKTGTVQRKLIGSSVDTVGRAVISPDPGLDIDQVGLPEKHAWEVYKPFVVRRLVRQGMDRLRAAKAVADKEPIARKALDAELEARPVVIGRAPTLHRYSLSAARPVIMHGDTLRIPPLVVKGFGADFDGDAMSYHVPASDEAVRDAYEKMLPSRNLLNVSEFRSHHIPSQEYIAGLHAASTSSVDGKRARTFATTQDAVRAWKRGELGVGDPVEVAGD